MPTVEENRHTWSHYGWERRGEEWSEAWGGHEAQWWGTVFPRLRPFLPAGTVLEIAPGFGRWTHYLAALCRRLVLVDLEPRCIEACRLRFADLDHLEYHVNDGISLSMVADGSIDFAFSFDSLVHVEAETIAAYLGQLATKLAPDGVGFFHHSNLGAFRDPDSGELLFANEHWRATSMSAARFDALCTSAGLCCAAQEIVNWGGSELIDCFSVFTRAGSRWARAEKLRRVNPAFMAEADAVRQRAAHYGSLTAASEEAPDLLALASAAWRPAAATRHGGPLRRLLRRVRRGQ